MSDARDLPAGDFSAWMTAVQLAIRGEGESDVPCGSCTACCTASQFIHIGPDETDTLAHIPVGVLFPAPRLPRGHVLMGYDACGHCPMLIDGKCSIYAHRPRTCRTYDCRVFPATGIESDDDKGLIAEQANRWSFSYQGDDDRTQHDAVRSVSVVSSATIARRTPKATCRPPRPCSPSPPSRHTKSLSGAMNRRAERRLSLQNPRQFGSHSVVEPARRRPERVPAIGSSTLRVPRVCRRMTRACSENGRCAIHRCGGQPVFARH